MHGCLMSYAHHKSSVNLPVKLFLTGFSSAVHVRPNGSQNLCYEKRFEDDSQHKYITVGMAQETGTVFLHPFLWDVMSHGS